MLRIMQLKKSHGITNSFKIIANIFISFIGAGMLGLPYAFKEVSLLCIIEYFFFPFFLGLYGLLGLLGFFGSFGLFGLLGLLGCQMH